MNWLRYMVACALVAALCYAGFALGYKPVQQHQNGMRSEISALEKDSYRLSQRLAALEKTGTDITFPETLLWRAISKPDAELALQDRIVGLAEEQGVTLVSFGTAPLSRDATQDQIALEIEGEAYLRDFYAFLARMEQMEQKVAIATLRLRPIQRSEDMPEDVTIYVQMTLWAYWDSAS